MRALLIAVALAACSSPSADRLGQITSALSVESAITSGGCSSDPVYGLSAQIVDELAKCVKPGFLVPVPSGGNLENGATHAFLEKPAADALNAALATRGDTLHVTSMFRTIAQQYYLYRHSSCFPAVAPPGTSNHETGIAFDAPDPDNSTWRSTLAAAGFVWLGSFDRYHFDYKGAGAVDLRGQDVLAFQRLWNKNHPEDIIAADGDFGPATEARLKASPAGGFPIGLDCSLEPPNTPPKGTLDAVGCDGIKGSAEDPDVPGAINVHLYFDSVPGDASAIARVVHASKAFARSTPRSLFDGKSHTVHAFAIDAAGKGPNPEIEGSPKTFTCATPALPTSSVKRWIPSPAVLAAWKLDTFEDLIEYDAAAIGALVTGPDWPAAPTLVSTDDAALGVRVLDGSLHRHVRDPASMDAWRFDWEAIEKVADLSKYTKGMDLPPRPFLAKGSGPEIYILDDRPMVPPPVDEDGGVTAPGVITEAPAQPNEEAGELRGSCAYGGEAAFQPLWIVALLLARRRLT